MAESETVQSYYTASLIASFLFAPTTRRSRGRLARFLRTLVVPLRKSDGASSQSVDKPDARAAVRISFTRAYVHETTKLRVQRQQIKDDYPTEIADTPTLRACRYAEIVFGG
jgi:hypothetical protein